MTKSSNASLVEHTVTLSVRVIPRAKRREIVGAGDGSLRVYVTAPPEGGRANGALIAMLAEWLDLKRSQIEIVAGASGRNKLVRIAGLSRAGIEKLSRSTSDLDLRPQGSDLRPLANWTKRT